MRSLFAVWCIVMYSVDYRECVVELRKPRVFLSEEAARQANDKGAYAVPSRCSTAVEKRVAMRLDDGTVVLLSREVFLPIEKLEV
jgi:hypothetical protein